jgi:hypothetical protein
MVMDYLEEHGHDINVKDNSGCTPLAWLTMSKQVRISTLSINSLAGARFSAPPP